jgi:hypothetical protein
MESACHIVDTGMNIDAFFLLQTNLWASFHQSLSYINLLVSLSFLTVRKLGANSQLTIVFCQHLFLWFFLNGFLFVFILCHSTLYVFMFCDHLNCSFEVYKSMMDLLSNFIWLLVL